MITLTENAVLELKALLQRKGASDTAGLRLGVQRGGCAGLQYTMQVAERCEEDQTIEAQYTAIKKLMGGKTVINRVLFYTPQPSFNHFTLGIN